MAPSTEPLAPSSSNTAGHSAAARPARPRYRRAFNLKARWIIHTVGPVWQGGGDGEPDLLASCYCQSLARADEVEASSVAFPAISTGIFGYPTRGAAAIAVDTVLETPTTVETVCYVCFDQPTWDVYDEVLSRRK
jgi:O-acetyl-ADP-ribose deacetylase (regulator of RNase III)